MRDGLTLLLERNGFEVAAAAADAEDLLRRVRAHRPQLVLTDIRMPPTHTDEGLTAALAIRNDTPHTAIAVLSQHVPRDLGCELLETADDGGGIGYMLKQQVASSDVFCSGLRRGGEGGAVLAPEVVSAMLRRSKQLGDRRAPVPIREGSPQARRSYLRRVRAAAML